MNQLMKCHIKNCQHNATRLVVTLAVAIGLGGLVPAESQARQRNILPIAGFGWTTGGDQVDASNPRQDISSGPLNFDEEFTAGGEIHVWFGSIWVLSRTLETLFTVGYHNDAQSFQGGSANFGQIVYDFIPTYRSGLFRYGAGISYQVNVRYSLTLTPNPPIETKFKDAFGQIISLGYDFSDRGRVDLRYQFIDYVVSNNVGLAINTKLNGNSLGLHFYISF